MNSLEFNSFESLCSRKKFSVYFALGLLPIWILEDYMTTVLEYINSHQLVDIIIKCGVAMLNWAIYKLFSMVGILCIVMNGANLMVLESFLIFRGGK